MNYEQRTMNYLKGMIMKKEISQEEVRYIAHLARLELSKEEEERFTGQLKEILTYVNKLKEIDTENVPPTSHLFPLKNVLPFHFLLYQIFLLQKIFEHPF